MAAFLPSAGYAASAVGGLRANRRDNVVLGGEDVTDLVEAFSHSGLVYRTGEMWNGPWVLTRAGRVLLDALLVDPSLTEAEDAS